MAQQDEQKESGALLIDLSPVSGIKQVSLSPSEIGARSMQALDNALEVISTMVKKAGQKMDELSKNAGEVELSFGLKLTAEGNAIITKAGIEATLNVKVTYKNPPK